MDAERHSRISELFLAASELAESERHAFLRAECAGDEGLVAEVLELLGHEDSSLAVDEPLVVPASEPAPLSSRVPERLGRYRVLERIGAGGMGVVYRGQQSEPSRAVALKVLATGFANEDARRRFRYEVEALGRLKHPGIATLYEADVADVDGEHPFFAMEFVDGRPLTEFARVGELAVADRLELLIRVCEAVHHAHLHGVLHRDLKPANILVDASGQPKVLDFGIARIGRDSGGGTLVTRTGQIVGTLPYMSPEQVGGDPSAIDYRADVYSLGVLAYETLTGEPPLDLDDVSIPTAVRRICEEDPAPLGRHVPELRGDLEVVVAKALEKDRERRYSSAAAFADDLRRTLHFEPIEARRPTALYKLRKFARRNRALVGGATFAVVALVAGAGVALWQAADARAAEEETSRLLVRSELDREAAVAAEREASTARDNEAKAREEALIERDRAAQERDAAEAVLAFLVQMLTSLRADELGRDVTVEELLDLTSRRLELDLAGEPELTRARLNETIGLSFSALGAYRRAQRHLTESFEQYGSSLGEGSPKTIELEYALVRVDGALGDFASSLDRAHALLDEAEASGDDAFVASAALQLGQAYLIQQDSLAAQPHLERALELTRVAPPADVTRYPSFVGVLTDVASAAGELGEYDRAEALWLEALERLGTHPKNAFAVAQARLQLAGMYAEADRLDEAEAAAVELRPMLEELVGDEHADVAQTLVVLAMVKTRRGEVAEAVELLQRSHEIREKIYGSDHPLTSSSLWSLASALYALGRHSDAIARTREVVGIQQRVLGPAHPNTLETASNLSVMLFGQREFEEAAAVAAESREAALDALPESHEARIRLDMVYANALIQLGRSEEARPLMESAARRSTERFGPDHRSTLDARIGLVNLLTREGRVAEAFPHVDAIIGVYRTNYGDRSPNTTGLTRMWSSASIKAGEAERVEGQLWDIASAVLATTENSPVGIQQIVSALMLHAPRAPGLLAELEARLASAVASADSVPHAATIDAMRGDVEQLAVQMRVPGAEVDRARSFYFSAEARLDDAGLDEAWLRSHIDRSLALTESN